MFVTNLAGVYCNISHSIDYKTVLHQSHQIIELSFIVFVCVCMCVCVCVCVVHRLRKH